MFSKILVPVDLAHRDTLSKAVAFACNTAREHKADICFVSVSGELPSEIARSSGEYGEKLQEFADRKAEEYAITVTALNLSSPDPAAEVDRKLLKAIEDTGADLVVMASHQPGLMEYIFSSHGGYIAAHAKVSVFVVR
ncbi:MAG: universal stress protein [Roseinatronobacter sp.]|uniref:Nucleotide-binding universal stress UspA family protein n=1 Tax=Roseinatronobacter monicus TaxID=393481 RepID=A0A543K9U8_9RHOB|nr:universal stress protein [Roseinatronobacter monicus]TQM91857.1 nucleotide-binding universal stress UspA family protein [Roseinatronobacter monicus]TVP97920.1 MAG: universal stress protein [Roseinatronobacter sp.]